MNQSFESYCPALKVKAKCLHISEIPSKNYPWCTYILPKFGDPSFNPSKVIARKSRFLPIRTLLTPHDLEGQGQIPPYTTSSKIYSMMHPTTKFDGPSFNTPKVIVCTNPFFAELDFLPQKTSKVKVKFHDRQSHFNYIYSRCTYWPNLVSLQ